MLKSFSILHIPPNGVEVTDGEIVSVRNTAGQDPHNAHAVVENSAITGINLQDATACFVDDGGSLALTGPGGTRPFGNVSAKVATGALTNLELPSGSTVITTQAASVKVQDADGTSVDCTPTIAVDGLLSYVGVPGTAALVTNGLSVKVANNGGGGALDGNVQITGGFINWVALASAASCLISDGFSTSVAISVSASDDFATTNVSAGALQSVGVSLAPTKAVVTNSQALTVPVTGTYTTTATLTVANGAVTAIVLS